MRIASFFGLMESSPDAAVGVGPTIVDMWLSAAEGDASGLWAGSLIATSVPEALRLGSVRLLREGRRPGRAGLLLRRRAGR